MAGFHRLIRRSSAEMKVKKQKNLMARFHRLIRKSSAEMKVSQSEFREIELIWY
jgi:hypothetical protein